MCASGGWLRCRNKKEGKINIQSYFPEYYRKQNSFETQACLLEDILAKKVNRYQDAIKIMFEAFLEFMRFAHIKGKDNRYFTKSSLLQELELYEGAVDDFKKLLSICASYLMEKNLSGCIGIIKKYLEGDFLKVFSYDRKFVAEFCKSKVIPKSLEQNEYSNIYRSSDLDIDINEFHEKIRQQELSKYSQHMHNYISIHNPDSRTVIDDVLSLLKIDNDTDKVDIADELIDGLCIEQNRTTFFDMCKSLYEDNTIYGNYLIQYFNSSIKYFYKENKVMLPPVEDTLFVYDSYYINGYKKRDFQESSPILNTYYRYDNDVHFGVAWAINKTTYKRSGFIIIDFTGGLLNPKMGTYLIKADRVIY